MALARTAKNKDIQIAVLTNVIKPTYVALSEGGYYEHFDAVIASCEVGMAKPDEEIYNLALGRLNTTANKSLSIDDKQTNLDPAIHLGFATILAQSPEQIVRDTMRYIAA